MIIAIIGASGAGKDTLLNTLKEIYGYKGVIPFTTRDMRPGEVRGKDYHFVSEEEFRNMISENIFAEYAEYTQKRFYGTRKEDYLKASNKTVVILTPNGYRQMQKTLGKENIFSVLVTAPLGTRVKRYIDRCKEEKFSYDDMNEINARVNRDYGMFLDMEKEVDLVVSNPSKTDMVLLAQSVDKAKRKAEKAKKEAER